VSVLVTEAGDTHSFNALEIAKKQSHRRFNRAVVTRYDLTLQNEREGLRFACAVAGYEGTGPHIASEILELFGFGDRQEIFAKISVGGDGAYYVLER
jgi:hypothetical protein